MLLAMLVHRKALEVDVPARAKLRFYWSRDVNGGLQAQVRHPVLHDLEVDGNYAGHLNSTTEADLSVTLGEVKVTDGKLRPRYVDGQVNLATTTQILDAVSIISLADSLRSNF